jgi:hypothetical protein
MSEYGCFVTVFGRKLPFVLVSQVKLMTCNSCFNFKLSECIGVFVQYIGGLNDCNEWKTEKRHECTNTGKVKNSNYDVNFTSRDLQFRDLENFRPHNFF